MQIGFRPAPAAATRTVGSAAHIHEHAQEPAARALIVTPPDRVERMRWGRRPRASFLAHLIATARDLPQTRVRRRAGYAEAAARYRAGAAVPEPPKTPLSRAV